MHAIHYRYADVDGRRLFYREAGAAGARAVVLLHGFPASSFMFRDLIPLLAVWGLGRGPETRVGSGWSSARACPLSRGQAYR